MLLESRQAISHSSASCRMLEYSHCLQHPVNSHVLSAVWINWNVWHLLCLSWPCSLQQELGRDRKEHYRWMCKGKQWAWQSGLQLDLKGLFWPKYFWFVSLGMKFWKQASVLPFFSRVSYCKALAKLMRTILVPLMPAASDCLNLDMANPCAGNWCSWNGLSQLSLNKILQKYNLLRCT